MSNYTVNYTNKDKGPISISEESLDTSTDLVLFGRKRLEYGKDMNQNLLNLLEHFACPEDSNNPGNPDLNRSGGKLTAARNGQIWYNTTVDLPYLRSASSWIPLFRDGSIQSNWGIITNGQQIPQPIGVDGSAFPYSECVWIVGPFTINGEITDYTIETDGNAFVTATSNIGPLVCNYLIIGIKGNINRGIQTPIVTVTPTPTRSVTPSISPLSTNLSSGLISFWEFNEAGAGFTFADSVGTNTFQRIGADAIDLPVGPPFDNSHGKIGKAIRATGNTFFEINPTLGMSCASLNMTNNQCQNASYTFGGWFALNSNFSGFSNLFQRGIFGAPGQRSFTLAYTLLTDSLTLYKSHDGSAYEFLQTPTGIGLNDFNFHFIVAWVTPTSLNIQIDNGTIYTTTTINSNTFNIGTLKLGSSTSLPLQSAVDQLFYYNRVLNVSERSLLWNNGSGVSAAFASGLVTPTPSPTPSPMPTMPPTPTLQALAVSVNKHSVVGGCNGAGCTVSTDTVFATVTGGIIPYAYNWQYVSGDVATVLNPGQPFTAFQRTGTAQTLVGYYRLRIDDTAGSSIFTPVIKVTTSHN